ncbi:MAG TPA: LacI family DNA-binding transcriptional regulator [Terriglobales bacterium]|jgi:LacI family transcriptional regulator|nr:LacI family DNA-binding transcriptional regulator [Terriglobales bacterium]
MAEKKKPEDSNGSIVTLKSVAAHVGLSAGTVSAVLNDAPSAKHIPKPTRERIIAAARKLDYRPNFFARSLRKQRTFTIGVIAHEIGDGYSSTVIAGIENSARLKNYFFVTGVHRHNQELFDKYCRLLLQRGAEGLISLDFNLAQSLPVPAVAIPGHMDNEGVTNIVLDHHHAAELALKHLMDFGHRRIAILKGHPDSADAASRWKAVQDVAREIGLELNPELVIQIDSTDSTPGLGYPFARKLIENKHPFTALFAYNDISAIGAIRAFQEFGWRVPQDVSVVGFDDIPAAAFHYPSLTTIRQPLHKMGEIAVDLLVDQIERKSEWQREIAVQPEIKIRESTGPVAA